MAKAKKKPSKNAPASRLAVLHAARLFTHITVDDLPETEGDPVAEAIDRNPGKKVETFRALQSIPDVVKRVIVKAGHGLVQITKGPAIGLYKPTTHHQWAGLVDAGLAAIGDKRRLIAIQGVDWEEPLFVLATPDQATAIATAKIEDDHNSIEMPEKTELGARLQELARSLQRKLGATVKAGAGEVVLELTPDQVETLVDKLYKARFDDQLVGHRVDRDYR